MDKSTLFNRLMRGGIWVTIGKILFTLGTLAWNALLTRVLNETEVGAFYLIASIVIFGELVILGGMNQAVMRLIATNSIANSGIRPVIRGTAILVACFALITGLLYLWFIGPQLGQQLFHSRLIGELTGFTAAWFALRAIQSYLAFILRGFHRIGIAAFVDGASTAIFITLALGYLWLQPEQTDIREVLAIVIGALASTVTLTLYLVQKSYRKTTVESGILFSEPIKIGAPLSILALSGVGINEAYIWIAGAITSHADVAVYGAASRLAKFVEMPLFIINGIIPSTIAQLSAIQDKARIEKVLQSVAAIAALPSILITIIIFLASGEILALVFGSTYSTGATLLTVLVIGHTVSVAVGSPGVLMAMSDRQTMLMLIGICAGVLGIGISLLLVGTLGVLGIVIGAATGKALHNIAMWAYCLKVLGIKTHASLFALTNLRHILKK